MLWVMGDLLEGSLVINNHEEHGCLETSPCGRHREKKGGMRAHRLLRQQVEKVEDSSEMTVLAAMPSSVVRLLLVE